MRVYPHLQDTGGFFVAILSRKGDVIAPLVTKLAHPLDFIELLLTNFSVM
jgi:hypothetical protein